MPGACPRRGPRSAPGPDRSATGLHRRPGAAIHEARHGQDQLDSGVAHDERHPVGVECQGPGARTPRGASVPPACWHRPTPGRRAAGRRGRRAAPRAAQVARQPVRQRLELRVGHAQVAARRPPAAPGPPRRRGGRRSPRTRGAAALLASSAATGRRGPRARPRPRRAPRQAPRARFAAAGGSAARSARRHSQSDRFTNAGDRGLLEDVRGHRPASRRAWSAGRGTLTTSSRGPEVSTIRPRLAGTPTDLARPGSRPPHRRPASSRDPSPVRPGPSLRCAPTAHVSEPSGGRRRRPGRRRTRTSPTPPAR